jgi:hypothetical protein
MKKLLIIALLPLLFGCKPKVNNEPKLNANGWQDLDLGAFKISVPPSWKYLQQQGIDSFVGEIKAPHALFSFDFSGMGYANSLIETKQQYLKREVWQYDCHFCKSGVTYVNNQTPDREAKKNMHIPTAKQKAIYPEADYIVDLTYKDSTVYIPVEIPAEIKSHHIQLDTTEKYIIKTIWPNVTSKGITGVYYQSRSSTLNFQMSAHNLSKQDQDLALQAFKTIVIKK